MSDGNTGKFLQIEKQYGLCERQVQGISYWVYSRFSVWREIQIQKYGLGVAHRIPKSLVGKFRIGMKLLYNTFLKQQHIKQNVDVFFINHPRRVYNDGYYECCYTSELTSLYENSLVGERAYLYHKTPIREKDIIYMDECFIYGHASYYYNKLLRTKKYREIRNQIEQDLTPALYQFSKVYEIDINIDKVIDMIARNVFICLQGKEIYGKILDKVNPKVIVEVVSYNIDCMIITEEAKNRGIFVIELQHGVMGREHIAYNYNEGSNIKQFPDYEFLFSDYWEKVTSLPIEDSFIKAVGFPYFEKQVRKYPRQQHKKKTIIFVSQGEIGAELSKFAVELSKSLDMKRWDIFYKLHPGEFESWEKEYPWLSGTEMKIVGKGGKGIYELFAMCDVQIGVYSTALFEGLGFGMKTLIYKIYRSEMFDELCRMGYAEFFSNVDECKSKLKDLDLPENIKTEFWKTDALYNIKEELDAIIDEKRK